MEQDGDDFGPLYSCAPVQEPHIFNDHDPSNFHTSSSELSVSKDLKDYDRFLLSECGANGGVDEFDDVEMEQQGVEFDSRGLDVERENDKMVEENEFNVVEDMDEENDYLEVYPGVSESFDMVCEHNENGVEGKNDKMVEKNGIDVVEDMMDEENNELKLDIGVSKSFDMVCEHNENGVGDLRGSANEEDSESDESLDIIIEDPGLNDHTEGSAKKENDVGNDKKDVEKKESAILRNCDNPDDLDDLEPGEIADTKTELGIDVETRVGHSYQSCPMMSQGVKSVFTSQTIDRISKGEENQVNPVRNADYTRFRYLPAYIKRAFDIEDNYLEYKPWKRPGVNLSDFFNFGLDEENWQKYRKQMIQLLQTSPSKAVGYTSEQLQSKNAPGQQTREAIQVDISRGERVACLENHHQSVCNSDAIIEIVFVDSPDETQSFTKELKDRALHDNKTRPTTIHKMINGDKILPFPLDGSFHQISHEERTPPRVSNRSQTDHQEGNDDHNKFNKGSAVDDHEQKLSSNCNLAKGNKVIPDDQNHEAKREENMNEESRKMQVSPKAGETCRDEMSQLISNIKGFMSEVDDLVHSHKHEHRICCLR